VPSGWLDSAPFGCLRTGLGYAIAARLPVTELRQGTRHRSSATQPRTGKPLQDDDAVLTRMSTQPVNATFSHELVMEQPI
jgi:hypothetical protein